MGRRKESEERRKIRKLKEEIAFIESGLTREQWINKRDNDARKAFNDQMNAPYDEIDDAFDKGVFD